MSLTAVKLRSTDVSLTAVKLRSTDVSLTAVKLRSTDVSLTAGLLLGRLSGTTCYHGLQSIIMTINNY